MKIEIVTHCWNYWRALTYQVSSLWLHPPKEVDVLLTVFCCPDQDKNTARRLEEMFSWGLPPRVSMRVWELDQPQLCRRAIGRNMAAKKTRADLVWFIDCDMTLGYGVLDELPHEIQREPSQILYYPRVVWVPTQERGDELIKMATDVTRPIEVDQTGFTKHRYNRAIGGVQIVKGDACREAGYLPDSEKWQRPQETWARTFEDKVYRAHMDQIFGSGTGARIVLENVCRIRHTQRGRFTKGLEL